MKQRDDFNTWLYCDNSPINPDGITTEQLDAMFQAWQAALSQPNATVRHISEFGMRTDENDGEDVVVSAPPNLEAKIAELEGKNKVLEEMVSMLEIRNAELQAQVFKTVFDDRNLNELTAKLEELTKFHSSADKLAEKQVECIAINAELIAKVEKMREALLKVSSEMSDWSLTTTPLGIQVSKALKECK